MNVLGVDRHAAPVLGQPVEESHGRMPPPAVDEPPRGTGGLRRADHRQDGGDADPAREEQILQRRDELEVVPWGTGRHLVADVENLMHVPGPAAPVGLVQYADLPTPAVGGITTQ